MRLKCWSYPIFFEAGSHFYSYQEFLGLAPGFDLSSLLLNEKLQFPLTPYPSSNHLICPRQHVGGYRESDLLRCLQVDHQLKLGRLLYWEIGGLCPF